MQVVVVGDLPYLHVRANVAGLPTCYGLVSDMTNKSATSWQQVVMGFGKRHDTTGAMDFCPRKLVTDLSLMLRSCADLLRRSRQLHRDLLRGNWCNGFWPKINIK